MKVFDWRAGSDIDKINGIVGTRVGSYKTTQKGIELSPNGTTDYIEMWGYLNGGTSASFANGLTSFSAAMIRPA